MKNFTEEEIALANRILPPFLLDLCAQKGWTLNTYPTHFEEGKRGLTKTVSFGRIYPFVPITGDLSASYEHFQCLRVELATATEPFRETWFVYIRYGDYGGYVEKSVFENIAYRLGYFRSNSWKPSKNEAADRHEWEKMVKKQK